MGCPELTLYTAGGGEASPVGIAMLAVTVRPRVEAGADPAFAAAPAADIIIFLSALFCPTAKAVDDDGPAGAANADELRTDTRRHVACARAGSAMAEMAAIGAVYLLRRERRE